MILQNGTKARWKARSEVKPLHPLQPEVPAINNAVKYSQKSYPSELTERVILNGEGSAKETIHLNLTSKALVSNTKPTTPSQSCLTTQKM